MSIRTVTFVAVNRPPGCIPIMTRPSPDLFGLIDATSNCGALFAAGAPPCCADGIATAATANADIRIFFNIRDLLWGGARSARQLVSDSVFDGMLRAIDDQ